MTKMTVGTIYKASKEADLTCTSCREMFIWSLMNTDPDYCPYCGEKTATQLWTNPEAIVGTY
jgi:RNA polymerase subunit RPABC4/transcription elongation factor Spt4